jgi:hypothetical protein
MAMSPAFSASDVLITRTMPSVWRRVVAFPVFLGAMLVFGVFVCVRATPFDPDTWWHIAVGSRILQTHIWPTTDYYSYIASGSPWIAYEWLGEVLMAAVTRAGGLVAAKALLILLASIFILLLYGYATLVCGNSKAAFAACALLLSPAALFFTLRPQLIGYVFLLVMLICLELFRRGNKNAIWLLPPLFLFWVNTHGSFAFGFLVLAVFWMSGLVEFQYGGIHTERWTAGQRRRLESVGLLSLLAALCTPYGTALFSYPLEMALLQRLNIADIIEWQPLDAGLVMGKWFLAFILLLLLAEILFRPTYRLDALALLLFATVVASLHRRFLVVFVVLYTPWLATLLSRWMPSYRPEKDKPILNALLITAAIVGLVFFFPTRRAIQQVTTENYPVGAVKYLETHLVPEPMLNEYGWGGYLIYKRGPAHKVFIDGRADIYEYSGVLADYQDIMLLKPDSLALLRKRDIRSCLLPRQAPLRTVLAALPEWTIVYEDKVSTLFVRRDVFSEFPSPAVMPHQTLGRSLLGALK